MNRNPTPQILWLLLLFPIFTALMAAQPPEGSPGDKASKPSWAIAIHGGAGTIPKDLPESRKQEYLKSLAAALEVGKKVLAGGGTSLDAVEQVNRFLEDDPLFNAGKGSVFTHEGTNELEAAIMDGRDLSCGAVAELKTVKNPISLARMVMEKSPHIIMVGAGAEKFADEMKVERVDPKYFFVQRRWDQLQEALRQEKEKESGGEPKPKGTVGAVALDVHGNLAAATSTGGMTNKRFGRLSDVIVFGAGTYANNHTAAISGTGWGEQFIKHTVAYDISALMEYKGLTLQQAADEVIHRKLQKDDGGIVAVDKNGAIAMVFNSEGMYRGAADSNGRFEVAIWE